MKKPRKISPDGLALKMSHAMRERLEADGHIRESVAGEIAARLTLEHFRKSPGELTPEEISTGKITGKTVMFEINNPLVVHEEEPGTITSDNMPADPS